MNSTGWIEQAHAAMTGRTILFLLGVAVTIVVYYLMHRRRVAARVVAWSEAKFNSRPKGRLLAKLAGWAVAATVLLTPLALIGVATRVATYVLITYYGVPRPGGWSWAIESLPRWAGSFLAVLLFGALLSGLDVLIRWPWKSASASTDPGAQERVTRIEAIRMLRRRVSGSAPYRLWFRAVAVCGLLLAMHLATSSDVLSGAGRPEPVPDSQRKDAILSIAREGKLDGLELAIKEVPHHMNAWGTFKDDGARIEFSKALWDRQNDKQFLAVVGHELYHVFNRDMNTLWAALFMMLALASCFVLFFVFGPRRQDGVARYNVLTRLPLYVILFAAAWPAFQAARCAIERPNEAAADRASVQFLVQRNLITPDDAKQALTEMNRFNLHDPDPDLLSWLLFYDHPPLAERLQNIDEAVKELGVETARR
jgi:Zn-dependent protease with chaperone function